MCRHWRRGAPPLVHGPEDFPVLEGFPDFPSAAYFIVVRESTAAELEALAVQDNELKALAIMLRDP